MSRAILVPRDEAGDHLGLACLDHQLPTQSVYGVQVLFDRHPTRYRIFVRIVCQMGVGAIVTRVSRGRLHAGNI